MRNTFFFLFLFTSLYTFSQQTIIIASEPEEVGIVSNRLNQVNTVMQRYVDEMKLPGMVTMIARHGKVVSFEKHGWMKGSPCN
jgi:hypothetical protein